MPETTNTTPEATPTNHPLPRDEMRVALAAARTAQPLVQLGGGRQALILPEGFTAQDRNDPHLLPPHVIQDVTLDDAQSLITYANRFSTDNSVLIADIDELRIHARLDWHTHNGGDDTPQAQPAKHTATLMLRESEEYTRWNAIQNKMMDQMVFAEFLDENACDIIDPEPAVMIEIARDLEATQGHTFKGSTRLQTGERSFSYESETHIKGDIKVPARFILQIPLFAGEAPVDIEASFRFKPHAAGLSMGFVWRRVEYRRQAEFQQIATNIAGDTGLPLFFGRA